MKELALHILDIVQNSIAAEASKIVIKIEEDKAIDILKISIIDDGKGMSPELLMKVTDPYTTSRKTRRVGMGLPLLKEACKQARGQLYVESVEGEGTLVNATMGFSHIDRQPLGDIASVISLLVSANPNIDLIYHHIVNGKEYLFDTKEVKDVLDGISLSEPSVLRMINEMIKSNLDEL